MSRSKRYDKDLAVLDELIEETTVDAYSDDEQLWAFRQAFEDNVTVPCDGFVIGEPVSVTAFDCDGNERRGLTARCHREDGSQHVVGASEVVLPPRSSELLHWRLPQVARTRTVPSRGHCSRSPQATAQGYFR